MNTSIKRQPNMGDRIRYLILSSAVTTFVLIVIGNLVRVSGSASGCPDWPTCFGQWGLPATFNAQIQYAHRAITVLAGLQMAAAALWARLRWHNARWISRPLYAAVALMVVEVLLGADTVFQRSPAALNALHLGVALAILACLLAAAVAAFFRSAGYAADRLSYKTAYARLTLAGLGSTFVVMVSGVFVVSSGAATACLSLLSCNGQLAPATPLEWIQMAHRLFSAAASLIMLVLLLAAWWVERRQRFALTAATASVILFMAQVMVGALKVSRGYPLDLVGLHAATSAGVWAALVMLVISVGLAGRDEEEERAEARQPIMWRQRVKDLILLTKPVIVLLLLVTTYAGMVLGGGKLPSAALTLWTMLGGALAAGGSSAINQYIDRDIDRNMQRTSRRPIVAGRMTPAEGLAWGAALCILAFYLLASFVNLLAALLALAGMIYYVVIYTILLKRITVQNIVIGGGAGAIPPLVGWAAATGSLQFPSLFLFAIIFMWTPPHFWALALVRRKDYERANVPMLPVVRGEQATRIQIFIYTLELVSITLLLPVLHLAGSIYLVASAALGGGLVYHAWRVLKKGGNKSAWTMYHFSNLYLMLLFIALVADKLIKIR